MLFSDVLIQEAEPHWQSATDHDFIREMVDGTLDTEAFSYYLIQDYAFVNAFVELLGYCIAYSTTMEQKHRLSSFLSMVSSEENDYFLRAFQELGVSEARYQPSNVELSPAMQGFHQVISTVIQLGATTGYANCLVVLSCAEMVYREWGVRHQACCPEAFYFNEWLTLHNNDDFVSFVDWLKSELDQLSDLPAAELQSLSQLFSQFAQLEAQFFDECYAQALEHLPSV